MTRLPRILRSLAPLALFVVLVAACGQPPFAVEPAEAEADGGLLAAEIGAFATQSHDLRARRSRTARAARHYQPIRIAATVAIAGPLDPLPEGCLAGFDTAIEGTATLLGAFTGVGSTCIEHQILPDPDPPFTASGPAPYMTAKFTNPRWTLTAADGDELWLDARGIAVISGVDNSLLARGSQRILGGTGRFAGATGFLEAEAVNDGTGGPDHFVAHGKIEMVAPR